MKPTKPTGDPAPIIRPRLLRVQDVARYLSATNWFVEELIRNKELPAILIGKRQVVDIHDLNRWINEQKKIGKLPDVQILSGQEAQEFFEGLETDEDGTIKTQNGS